MARNWLSRMVDERPLIGWPLLIAAGFGMFVTVGLISLAIAGAFTAGLVSVGWVGTRLFGDGFISATIWILLGVVLVALTQMYWQRLRP